MQLSPHFTLEEMVRSQTATRHGINNRPNAAQTENLRQLCLQMLEPIRSLSGGAIIVTSGFRSPVVNSLVGGSPTSQHKFGEAADIDSTVMSQQQLFQAIQTSSLPFDQLIDEFGSWVHVSFTTHRPNRGQVLRARKVNGETRYTIL